MKWKKVGIIINIISFIVIVCLLRLWGVIASHFIDNENFENREMAQKPVLSAETFVSFPLEYENYFNDNIPFRNQLISLNNKIDYFIFDKSTDDRVIKGKNGWLFYTDTLVDYQHTNLYSEEELNKIKNDALTTAKFMKDRNIEFVIIYAPNKSTIYGDYMPAHYTVESTISRADQLIDYLRENTDIKIIYAKESLMEARSIYPELTLFLKQDTHWNYMGGYIASMPLLSELGHNPVSLDSIDYTEVNKPDFLFNGYDLSNMLGLSDILNKDINYDITGYTRNDVTYEGDASQNRDDFNGYMRTYSSSEDSRKIFLARDSFGEAITPFLAAEFSEMYSVHKESLTLSQFEAEQPDIFIWQGVERAGMSLLNVEEWPE